MDKYEYKVRSEEISKLIEKEKYAEAVKIADTIDWRRVKSATMLLKISALYRVSRRNEDSREILILAYERYPGNRSVVYALCELSIELDDVVSAIEYYKKFVKLAPKDNGVYTLRYRILEAQEASLEERIEILEELKKKDYQEEWAYELAYLYHRVGLSTKCVEECDDIILWFGDGAYVMKAMELKAKHVPLTDAQLQSYNIMLGNAGQNYSSGNYDAENYDAGDYHAGGYDEQNGAPDYSGEGYVGQNYDPDYSGEGYDGQNYAPNYSGEGYDGQNYGPDYNGEDNAGQNYGSDYNGAGYDGQSYAPNYNGGDYDGQNYAPNYNGGRQEGQNYASNYGGEGYVGQDYNGEGYSGQNYSDEGYDGQNYENGGYIGQNYDNEGYQVQNYINGSYDGQNYQNEGYSEQDYDSRGSAERSCTVQGYTAENYNGQNYGAVNYNVPGYVVESDNGQDYGEDGFYADEAYGNAYGQENGSEQQYAEERYPQNNFVDDGYGNLSYVNNGYPENGYTGEFYVEQTYDENGNLINPDMYADNGYAQDSSPYSQTRQPQDAGHTGQSSTSKEYRNGLHVVENPATPPANAGDMSQYNTINLQKVVAESMKELFPDDNDDVFAEDREKYNAGEMVRNQIGDTRIFAVVKEQPAGAQTTGRVNIAQMVTGVSEAAPEPHTGAIKKVLVPGGDARSIKSDSDMEELRDTTEQSVEDEHARMESNDENVYHEKNLLNTDEEKKAPTGPMKLDNVLAEWERMKQDNARKNQEQIKQRVLTQTGKIFTNFDNSIKSGILGELEREEAEAERKNQKSLVKKRRDGFLDADITGDIPQQPASDDDFDVSYGTAHDQPAKVQKIKETGEIPTEAALVKAADVHPKQTIDRYSEMPSEKAKNVYSERTPVKDSDMYAEASSAENMDMYAEASSAEATEVYPEVPLTENRDMHAEAPSAENADKYSEKTPAEEARVYSEETSAKSAGAYTEELFVQAADAYREEAYSENSGQYTEEIHLAAADGLMNSDAETTDDYTAYPDTERVNEYAEATEEYSNQPYGETADDYPARPDTETADNNTAQSDIETADDNTVQSDTEPADDYAAQAYDKGASDYTQEIYIEESDASDTACNSPQYEQQFDEDTDAVYSSPQYEQQFDEDTDAVYNSPHFEQQFDEDTDVVYNSPHFEQQFDEDLSYADEAGYSQDDADISAYADEYYAEDPYEDLEDAYSDTYEDARDTQRRQNDQYNERALDPEDAESIAEMAKEDALKTQEIKMNTADLSSLSEKIVATTKKEANGAKREEVRDFTPEEQTLFENFAVTKKIKKQIIYALENMTIAAYTGNVILTGDAGLDTMRMAKNLIKEYQEVDENFSGKLAKITGEKINQRNIKDIFEKLNNGGIIIEKANGMTEEKLYELAINLNQDTLGIVVIMEDTKKEITKLLEKQAMIVDYFNIRIDLMEMDNNALVAYAKNYALALEYSIDELGTLALYTRIANMQSGNHVVTKDEVRDIIDEAIWKSKKSKIKNFVDVLFARRYDDEDMIVLKERDFM